MASDNMAVDVVIDVDAMSVQEIEAGLGSSRMHLLQQERPASIKQSIKKSLTKSSRKAKYYLSFVFAPFKWFLLKFKLLILIGIYSCFGAWLFQTLEVPNDLAAKEEAYHARLIARDVVILKLRAIHLENKEDREIRWKDAVLQFETDVGLPEPSMETVWTFWMAFLYAGTLYTTIGYGNIACQTRGGQVATLVYAFVGIPITLVLLNGLGDVLLKITKFSAGFSSDIILFAGVRWGITPLEEGSEKRKRYIYFCHKLSKTGIFPAPSHVSLEEKQESVQHDPPVISAIILTIAVMFTSAAIFSHFEGWDLFTSWYFFFISCSTIGLGDVVPSKPEFMIVALGVMFVGLAMVTVCFNVIQEKLELMFMEMMNKLMEDYLKALESGDPNATGGMMKGFKGRAKFLMPLMSKNTGATAMNKFKDKCAEKGIEPPAVFTNINPETGMPAFANANSGDFKEFIEQAEEKQAEERRLVEERVQSRLSNPPEVVISTVPVFDVGVQAEIGPVFATKPEEITFGTQTFSAPNRSFGAQYTPPANDVESQTMEVTNIDEGIQTWPSCADSAVQYDAVSFASCSIQYDIPQLTTTSAVGGEPKYVSTTGIQPEVSMFAVSDSSDEETTEGELSDDEKTESLEEKLENLTLPTIQRLRKSVSEESQDTVVSVSPSMSPTSRRRKLEEKKNKKKKKKTHMEGLRFMRHSADQTSFDSLTIDTQTDFELSLTAIQVKPETSEQSVQYYVEKKGRKSQTKITCIPVEKVNLGMKSEFKTEKKRLKTQASNVSTPSSQLQSASSFEGLAKHPSLRSISESELPLSEGDVNLGVSDVVDKEGFIVEQRLPYEEHSVAEDEMTGFDIGDDIFDSEEDFLDEEMEQFVHNETTQTDLALEDTETQASAADMNILRDILCQTELSSFHIRQKSAQSRKKAVQSAQPQPKMQEVTIEGEKPSTSESAEGQENETAVTIRSLEAIPEHPEHPEHHEPTVGEEEQLSGEEEEEETRGLMESAVQTAQTMVYVGEQEEGEEQEEFVSIEEGVQYLVDTGTNPALELATVSCQTEAPYTSTTISTTPDISHGEQEVQATISYENSDTQYSVLTEEAFVQTVYEQVNQEIQATPNMESTESQATVHHKDHRVQVEGLALRDEGATQVQTQPDTTDSATSTMVSYADIETQTTTLQTHTGVQPQTADFSRPHAAQVTQETKNQMCQSEEITLETRNQMTQMDPIEVETRNQMTQIELVAIETRNQLIQVLLEPEVPPKAETSEIETQTDKKLKVKEQAQTEENTKSVAAEAVTEYAPIGINAIVSTTTRQAQSDVSMFVVDQLERSRLELQHGVRFNVDSGTWMEERSQKHVGIQRDAVVESSGVQVRPSMITSHTQYIFACASDQHTQTDIVMKSKKSQMNEFSQNTAMETEGMQPEGADGPLLEQPSSMLWSDFDPIIEEWDEDITQASYQARLAKSGTGEQGLLLQVERGLAYYEEAIGPDGKTKMIAVKYDAGCSAGPDILEAETQTGIDVEDRGTGFEGDEDWIQVYVQELDEERRNRMFDIGIQTGVLARVQHMYGKKESATPAVEEGGNVDILKVSLRKTESTETLSRKKWYEGSEENLSHASSVRSIAESIDDPISWPSSSRTPPRTEIRRSASMRKPSTRKKDASKAETVVAETIRRFEERASKEGPEERRARSSSPER